MMLWQDFRFWLSSQPGYHDLRGWQVGGWRAAWERLFLLPRILRAAPVPTPPDRPDAPVSIHVMCHRGDWILVPWMLHSLVPFLPEPWPVVIHLQTELPPSAPRHLQRLFPQATLIRRRDADEQVNRQLMERRLARSLHWRHSLGTIHKLLDLQLVGGGRRRVGLDPDIIFFRRPEEILRAAADPSSGQWFQRDIADAYSLTREEARAAVPLELPPCVNTGITVRNDDSLDLDLIESLLAIPVVARPIPHLEQALAAFCASARHEVRYLPETYYLDLHRARVDTSSLVCRHYAGPSKRYLGREGLRSVIRQLGL